MPFLTPMWGPYFWLIDPRSFYNFWSTKARSRVCLRPLRVSMKRTKDTLCYYLPICSRKITVINQRSGDWFWWWTIGFGGSLSIPPKAVLRHVWGVYCFAVQFFLGCSLRARLFFCQQATFQTSDASGILIFCQSDTRLMFTSLQRH